MRPFVAILERLSMIEPVACVPDLSAYLGSTPSADAAWAVALLSGRKLPRLVRLRSLSKAVCERVAVPAWLCEASRSEVGDLAETIALLGSSGPACREPLSALMAELSGLEDLDETQRESHILSWLDRFDADANRILVTLAAGRRITRVPRSVLASAIASAFGLDRRLVERRLAAGFEPTSTSFDALVRDSDGSARLLPRPFALARPIEELDDPGSVSGWTFEWKWDGMRGQIVRDADVSVWNRRLELVTDRFPELVADAERLPPETIIDGELVVYRGDVPSYAALEPRIGARPPSARVIGAYRAGFVAYDVIRFHGRDVRELPIEERRAILERVLPLGLLTRSEALEPESWEAAEDLRASARERGAEGLMLKRRASPYRDGREHGEWWKWKLDPFSVDAVLVYATRASSGSGFGEFAFAVRTPDGLVQIGKAPNTLDDVESEALGAWVAEHTRERFGPVCSVYPELVFELCFDGISPNRRKRSGIDLRRLRIVRRRRDKSAEQADSFEDLDALLDRYG